MTEELKLKQDNLFWEWSQDLKYIEVLWILETDDGKFYQKFKKVKIGENNKQ